MRLSLILLILFFSCTNNARQEQKKNAIDLSDSVPIIYDEPFDLKVKKYEDPTRQSWQDPRLVLTELGDLTDKVVADIGSGTGYFTFQLAGAAQKVIAIDIEQRFLDYIEDRKIELSNRSLANKIETRLTSPDNPSIGPGEVDNVLMVNTFSYIENRDNYLRKIREGMKPTGMVVIVDYKPGVMPIGPANDLKVSMDQVIKELRGASFKVIRADSVSLQYQYIITSIR